MHFNHAIIHLWDAWALRGPIGGVALVGRLPPLSLPQRVCEERRLLLLGRHRVRPREGGRAVSRRRQCHGSSGNSLNRPYKRTSKSRRDFYNSLTNFSTFALFSSIRCFGISLRRAFKEERVFGARSLCHLLIMQGKNMTLHLIFFTPIRCLELLKYILIIIKHQINKKIALIYHYF